MSRNVSSSATKNRPNPLQGTKSFTRYEPAHFSPVSGRSRASTAQGTSTTTSSSSQSTNALNTPTSPRKSANPDSGDLFDKSETIEEEPSSPSLSRSQTQPDRSVELPIELVSLIDRFVESLGAKTWNEPPTIDQLSDLYQAFYVRAAANISTHIAALQTRLNRETSPRSGHSQTLSTKEIKNSTASTEKSSQVQQMLTADEVTQKRRARRQLEYKRILLEEAVEKLACEKVYDKIWRHKSTLDEVRDEKLRSKTAALALVGIGLKDLGIEFDSKSDEADVDVEDLLAPAREGLAKMTEERCPLGKLEHLTNAHKSIVDTLSTIRQSSSSADEILPTLIYTLITSPMEGINIISNLYFIQRFRAASKIDGEAAYCLVNLEAAISFLENVDLASLRADEAPEGPLKTSSRPATPALEKSEPFPDFPISSSTTSKPTTSTSTANASGTAMKPPPQTPTTSSALPGPRHQRTLSNLLQPSSKIIGAANDVVRNTAEEGFKNVSNTLDNSFKFLFGKLRERVTENPQNEVVVPKTLDEARQLVNRPLTPEDDVMTSETSSIADRETDSSLPHDKPADDKVLSLIGGRKAAFGSGRDRSVDSVRSNGSGKKAGFSGGPAVTTPTTPMLMNPLDSVKNLGSSSFNPLNHIGSALGGGFRSFSKVVSPASHAPPPVQIPTSADEKEKSSSLKTPTTRRSTTMMSVPKSVADEVVETEPPIDRFMDMLDARELKLGEVAELLRDYQRLARVLKGLSMG